MKNKIVIFIICTLVISVTTTCFSNTAQSASIDTGDNTYYVSTTGNDANSGSLSSPWRHINYAINHISAGATVLVRSGTYSEKVTMTKSGTSSAKITLKNYNGESPIIDGSGTGSDLSDGVILIQNLQYIIVDGFRINNCPGNGIRIGSSNHITIQNCYTYNSGFSGIRTDNSWGGNFCSYIYIYYNTISKANTKGGQEAMSICQTHDFEINHNTLKSDCTKEGLCCKESCYNGVVAYNDISTPHVNLYIGGGETYNFQVYGNYCHGPSVGCALGGEVGEASLTNFWVYNNIFANNIYPYRNVDVGVEDRSQGTSCFTDNINFINNVFHSKGGYPCLVLDPNAYNNRYTNTVIRNNIFYGGTGITINSNQPTSELTVDHNFFADGSVILGTDYSTGDPIWINPSAGDYHQQSNSPAIDFGCYIDAPSVNFDITPRPQETTIDTETDKQDTSIVTETNQQSKPIDTGATQQIIVEYDSDETTATESNNNPPSKPTIKGKITGKTDTEYEYKFVSTDPEGDNITYNINWGDNTKEVKIGQYQPGIEAPFIYLWSEKSNYVIKVKAIDVHGAESNWATFKISIIDDPITQLIHRISERFPLLEKILNQYYI